MKNNKNILTKLIVLIIVIALILAFVRINRTEVEYVRSTIDNNKYRVRNLKDKQEAANILANIKINIDKFVAHLNNNSTKAGRKEFKQYINQLTDRIKICQISESEPGSVYTSYSINKGEEIIFCLRSKKDNKLHDINLIMFVCIHELSHVACPEIGHGDLFKKIFVYFLKEANKQQIYKIVDYSKNSEEYCGMILNETPVSN